jgi:hypothetical protein
VRNEVLTLFGVTYVPGVKVSGTVPLNTNLRQRLTLSGSKAARGTITVTSRSITGRLGGRRISLVARAAGAGGAVDANYRKLLRLFKLRHAG